MKQEELLNILMAHGAFIHCMEAGGLHIHFTSDVPERERIALRKIYPEVRFSFKGEKPGEAGATNMNINNLNIRKK